MDSSLPGWIRTPPVVQRVERENEKRERVQSEWLESGCREEREWIHSDFPVGLARVRTHPFVQRMECLIVDTLILALTPVQHCVSPYGTADGRTLQNELINWTEVGQYTSVV